MDAMTIQKLNAINREFYRVTADEFDQTRGQAWPGWEVVWSRIEPHVSTDAFSALDVGCGNGRFGVFLWEKFTRTMQGTSGSAKPLSLQYRGMDNNPRLLEHAQAALSHLPHSTFTLEQRDIVENPPDTGQYDLVVLFGVMHHIPGAAQRLALMRALAARVKPGGWLAFACWRFYEYERFRERIAPWPEDMQVEAGDYLLDWRRGEVALRYCHYVDDAEHAALIDASRLREIATFRADGQGGDANQYSVLRRD
jgi:tRNA (uracil-5-)-methyltransferase TRM9